MFKSLLLKTTSGVNLTQSDLLRAKAEPIADVIPAHSKSSKKYAGKTITVGVIGAKGGVGATTLAVNLAVLLSTEYGTTRLLDANLQQPDAAILLGVDSHGSIDDLIQRQTEIDITLLEACSTPVVNASDCSLISPLANGSSALSTDLSQVVQCLKSAEKFSPLWVIDLPNHLDKHLVELMDKCDQLLLVLEPTLTGIACANRWVSIFAELGYSEKKWRCVLNRSGGKMNGVEEQLKNFKQFANVVRIPNSFSLLEKSSNEAIAAVLKGPKDAFSVGIAKLARLIVEGQ